MDKKNITNRKVDKLKVDKSKELLWQYMQSKMSENSTEKKKNGDSLSIWDRLKSIFTPMKVSFGGIVAAIMIFILVLGPNLSLINRTDVVYASFEMVANESDELGIESDTNFTLMSSEDLDEDVIAELLELSPEVEFKVNKIGAGKYEIDPVDDLDVETIYNFTIVGQVENEEGELIEKEFSWAYQVKDDFKVVSSIPGNKGTGVGIDSGIEIKFSHDEFDFEAAKNSFSIYPEVPGRFEKYYRTLVFVPTEELEHESIYKVNLSAGFGLEEGDKKLEEDYSFQFETSRGESNYDSNKATFSSAYYEFSENSVVATNINIGNLEGFSGQVEVYKYSTREDFMEVVKEKSSIPNWTYYAKNNVNFSKENVKFVGTYDVLADDTGIRNFIYLPNKNFDEGYYLFELTQDGYDDRSQALIQITDLSAYYQFTTTETLFWIHDLSTGKAAEGIEISIDGKELEILEAENGVVIFETPEELKNNDLQQNSVVEISSSNGKELILDIPTNSNSEYLNNFWNSLYLDRPIYQQNDKARFWGFIQAKDGNEQPENVQIRLTKSGAWSTISEDKFIFSEEIELNNDFFNGEIEIKNYLPGYYYLQVLVDGKVVQTDNFEVSDYTKPSYEINLIPEKNYVFYDEGIEIDVETKFFDGTPVPFTDLEYYEDGGYSEVTTDKKGESQLSFESDYPCTSSYCMNQRYFYLDMYPSLAEESAINGNAFVTIFNSRLNLGIKSSVDGNIAKFDFQTNWIDLEKMNSGENAKFDDYIGESANNRVIEGEINKITWEKIENGEYYDFISKKVVPKYRYERNQELVKKFTVNSENNGIAHYEFEMDNDAIYQVQVQTKDNQGKPAYSTRTVSNNLNNYASSYLYMDVLGKDENGRSMFDLDEEVEVVFNKGEGPLSVGTEGEFLFIKLSNGYKDHTVENTPKSVFEFSENYIPNVQVAGVWFNGVSYSSAYDATVYFNKEVRRLDVNIESDKEFYNPGEEVEMTIQVTDQNGEPVKSEVNLNLVDEAIFKLVYDQTEDPLSDIYSFVSSGTLKEGDTHQNPLSNFEGDGGKGGCFVAGTEILMEDGSVKAIEDIQPGDRILTKKKEFSGELVPGNVVKTLEHYVDGYLIINDDLKITPEHVLFVNGRWMTAHEVRLGDKLLGKDGELVEVYNIEESQESVMVYNFEVEEYHTYFADGFYVHNQKGGNDVRKNFEDTAAFMTLATDTNGFAKANFTLPDNITSWRVMAKAIDNDELQAGFKVSSIDVSLPFFVDIVMNDSYSIKDKPVVKLRAFGEEIEVDDLIRFVVNIEDLGLEESDSLETEAFGSSYFELPELKLGKHKIGLSGELFSAEDDNFTDAILEEFEVVGSRFKENIVEHFVDVKSSDDITMNEIGYSEITFINGGIAGQYQDLMRIYFDSGERVDQLISETIASKLASKYFTETWSTSNDVSENLLRYQDDSSGGIKLFPYGSEDLELSASVAFIDSENDYFNSFKLADYFYGYLLDEESNLSEIVQAMFGLASLGEPILNSLYEIKDEESLKVEDKIFIGLGLIALGDIDGAEDYYTSEDLYDELSEGRFDDNLVGFGAMYAANIGELNESAELWNLIDIKWRDDLFLERLGIVKSELENSSTEDLRFKITYSDGDSEVIDLGKFETFNLIANQTFEIEIEKGDLDAVSRFEKFINSDEVETDSRISIQRSYYVDGVETNQFTEGDLVKIILEVDAENNFKDTGFEITDILPSGLRVVTGYQSRGGIDTILRPHGIEEQEVYFYWWNGEYSSRTLEYYAKVVSPGEYYAEPAKIEASENSSMINISQENTIYIEPIE